MAGKENPKKQVPLRLSKTLYDELTAWAEDDFRSLNGQIEYLLTECVRKRRKMSRFDDETDGEEPVKKEAPAPHPEPKGGNS